MRHFDLWQIKKREHIVLRGKIVKFSHKDGIHLPLGHIGQRSLTEASPHDTSWGPSLSACDRRVFSPDTWCGLDPLGQTLEHAR